MSIKPISAARYSTATRQCGFSLVELLVVIAIIGVLSSILLPALAKAKARGQGMTCLNNTRQLTVAWIVYSDEHEDKLAYNLKETKTNSVPMSLNWVNNVESWLLDSDNTNASTLVATGIGPYVGNTAATYRCPADYVLSSVQQTAGWPARVRSYSMNLMVGDAGDSSAGGKNEDNLDLVQFSKASAIPNPSEIFVFLDEHPDSIDDGSFNVRMKDAAWRDGFPASYHEDAASLSFADGHSESHRWRGKLTKPAGIPDSIRNQTKSQNKSFSGDNLRDFYWVLSAMSVPQGSHGYHY